MKIPKPFLLLFAALTALGALTPPRASAQVDADFFYTNLQPYGEWVNCSYGYCWHPTNVDPDWAPYTDGYWAYTDAGWTWVSYEDYGGIVYHYGRWINLDGEGWVWVPGTQWAPAWVSWRSSPDYVGWAPLPPEAEFHANFGFGRWVDARFNIGPGSYNFVNVGNFGEPALRGVIVKREKNVTIINNTTNITNITNITDNTTTVHNTTVYTGGPSYATISAASSRPIPTLHLVRQGDPASLQAANGKIMSHQQGNQLVVLAPRVTAPAGGKFLAPPGVAAKNLPNAHAVHGWNVVKDPQQLAKMQAKVKTEGAKYTPAKAVNPADIKLVSDKIKANPAGPKAPVAPVAPMAPVAPVAPEVAKAVATPGSEVAKDKKAKVKPAATEDLVNKPAAEASATPKAGKGKKKHPAETPAAETATAEASPTPKAKKKKPAVTETAESASAEAVATPKEKKKKPAATPDEASAPKNPNLHPFTTEEESKPKPKTPEAKPKGEESPAKKHKAKEDASPVQQ